jgi:hypothetical protein
MLEDRVVRPDSWGHPDELTINPRWQHLMTSFMQKSPKNLAHTNISNIIYAYSKN